MKFKLALVICAFIATAQCRPTKIILETEEKNILKIINVINNFTDINYEVVNHVNNDYNNDNNNKNKNRNRKQQKFKDPGSGIVYIEYVEWLEVHINTTDVTSSRGWWPM